MWQIFAYVDVQKYSTCLSSHWFSPTPKSHEFAPISVNRPELRVQAITLFGP
jgi:hypothetical protein